MTIVHRDGFSHYATTTLKAYSGGAGTFHSTPLRHGIQCLQPPGGQQVMALGTNQHATIGQCIAVYKAGSDSDFRWTFLSDAGATTHVTLQTKSDGSIAAYRGTAAGTLLGQSSPGLLPVGGYFQLEAKAVLGDSTAGSIEVRLNGNPTPILSVPATDTKNAGTKTVFDAIGLFKNNALSAVYVQDWVVWNGAGSVNNTWLGDVYVETLFPSGAGATTGMTPSTGANYAAVDETPPNTTDYVFSDVDNTLDTYTIDNLVSPTTAEVKEATIYLYASKSDAGARSIAPVLRSGGTDYAGTDQALATGWAYYKQSYEQDPATSAAWLASAINALEAGAKVRP